MLFEHVMSRVEKGTPDSCWLWKGPRNQSGYGSFSWRGKSYVAHRWMYEYSNDVVLCRSDMVCHRCDNPPCVNPKHLFSGTAKDNWLDSCIKGRTTHILPNTYDPDLLDL